MAADSLIAPNTNDILANSLNAPVSAMTAGSSTADSVPISVADSSAIPVPAVQIDGIPESFPIAESGNAFTSAPPVTAYDPTQPISAASFKVLSTVPVTNGVSIITGVGTGAAENGAANSSYARQSASTGYRNSGFIAAVNPQGIFGTSRGGVSKDDSSSSPANIITPNPNPPITPNPNPPIVPNGPPSHPSDPTSGSPVGNPPSGSPTDPTRPPAPFTPPTDPGTPPTDPTDPTDPGNPPTDPTNPGTPPTDPTDPTDPGAPPTDPTNPTDPGTPPTDPTDPGAPPTDPTDPSTPPINPTDPTDPATFQAIDDKATDTAGGTVTIPVTSNDIYPAGDTVQVDVSSNPTYGTATADSNGSVTYVNDGTMKNDSFQYRLSDAEGNVSYATVVVDIQAVPAVGGASVAFDVNDTSATDDDLNFVAHAIPVKVTYTAPDVSNDSGEKVPDTSPHTIEIKVVENPAGSDGGTPSFPESPDDLPASTKSNLVSESTADELNAENSDETTYDPTNISEDGVSEETVTAYSGVPFEIYVQAIANSTYNNDVMLVAYDETASSDSDSGSGSDSGDGSGAAPEEESGESGQAAPSPGEFKGDAAMNNITVYYGSVVQKDGTTPDLTQKGLIYNSDTPQAMVDQKLYRVAPRTYSTVWVKLDGGVMGDKKFYMGVNADGGNGMNSVSGTAELTYKQDTSFFGISTPFTSSSFGASNPYTMYVRGALVNGKINQTTPGHAGEIHVNIYSDSAMATTPQATSAGFSVAAIPSAARMSLLQNVANSYSLPGSGTLFIGKGTIFNLTFVSDSGNSNDLDKVFAKELIAGRDLTGWFVGKEVTAQKNFGSAASGYVDVRMISEVAFNEPEKNDGSKGSYYQLFVFNDTRTGASNVAIDKSGFVLTRKLTIYQYTNPLKPTLVSKKLQLDYTFTPAEVALTIAETGTVDQALTTKAGLLVSPTTGTIIEGLKGTIL